jgi:DNA polymerase III sliding clamp (beta) subunit (PCNA family)
MVATDGHRLAFEEKAVGSLGLTKGVILPRKGLSELIYPCTAPFKEKSILRGCNILSDRQ